MRGILPLLFVAACTSNPQRAPAKVVEGTARAADGVEIAYDDRGPRDTDRPALVFLHGWSCDRAFWREQLEAFAQDHRVVALDFAGHGKSGANRATWTVPGLAQDVQAVVERLDLRPVILVGHSMGGVVALEAAHRMPGRVVAVVGADTLHDAEARMTPEMILPFAEKFEADFRGTMEAMVAVGFPSDGDRKLAEWVIDEACKSNHAAVIALMRSYVGLDTPALFRGAGVPIRCINAAPREGARSTEVERNREYADFDALYLQRVGHFLMLEKPSEFDACLRQILAALPAAAR